MLALDRAQRGSAQFLTFMSQYICHATSAGQKAGRLSTNKSQFVDRLSTNKAYFFFIAIVKLYQFSKILCLELFGWNCVFDNINTLVLRGKKRNFSLSFVYNSLFFFNVFMIKTVYSFSLMATGLTFSGGGGSAKPYLEWPPLTETETVLQNTTAQCTSKLYSVLVHCTVY